MSEETKANGIERIARELRDKVMNRLMDWGFDVGPGPNNDLLDIITKHLCAAQVKQPNISPSAQNSNPPGLTSAVPNIDTQRLDKLNELTPEGGELRIVAEDGGIWLEQQEYGLEPARGLSDPCETLREAIDSVPEPQREKRAEDEGRDAQ